MRIRDWSSDGCSSDLLEGVRASVAAVASTGEEIRGRRMGSLRDELKFVAYAVMHLWLADGDDVQEWETAVLRLLTSGDTRATAVVIGVAYANREQLGNAWWRPTGRAPCRARVWQYG